MPIKFFNEDTNFKLKERNRIKNWIKEAITTESFLTGQINYIFTSDKYLLELNKQYLSHNYFTDIITFNYCENKTISGDIYISINSIENNSNRFDVSFNNELKRVMIHGIIHLLGFDDKTEEEKTLMREKENYYLDRLKKLS